MFFHSISSLIIFLPIVFIVYPILQKKNVNLSTFFLLFFSLTFYAYDVPWFVIPLIISATLDYLISYSLIKDNKIISFNRNILLLTSLLINIGLLIIFKYSIFISENIPIINNYLPTDKLKTIILPAGISFYTFQTYHLLLTHLEKNQNNAKINQDISYM